MSPSIDFKKWSHNWDFFLVSLSKVMFCLVSTLVTPHEDAYSGGHSSNPNPNSDSFFFSRGSDSFCVGWLSLSLFDPCLIRELKQPQRRTKFAYLTMKNSIFARFARVHFSSFDILKTFSFFLRLKMTCLAVVWTTWAYNDKCSILSSYVPSASSNFIPGYLEHIFQA